MSENVFGEIEKKVIELIKNVLSEENYSKKINELYEGLLTLEEKSIKEDDLKEFFKEFLIKEIDQRISNQVKKHLVFLSKEIVKNFEEI